MLSNMTPINQEDESISDGSYNIDSDECNFDFDDEDDNLKLPEKVNEMLNNSKISKLADVR